MPNDFHFRTKIPVGILGATGSVGQRFVQLLENHPWFELVAVAASDRSVGKRYRESTRWMVPGEIPSRIADLEVLPCIPEKMDCKVVFSALDSSVAGEIEENFANAGFLVLSNAKNHRDDPQVPLLIPEVNHDHLGLLAKQPYGKGKIVTNPNCAAVGLCMALKPLVSLYGVDSVHVVTMQSASGAGYPGVPSMDILDNIIPYINDEEPKLESEPRKILGTLRNDLIDPLPIKISAQCNRVPVTVGHMEAISVKFAKPADPAGIIDAWETFGEHLEAMELPSMPQHPIRYFREEDYPQPRLHRFLGQGMGVSIGRLRQCPLLDYKFIVLSNNMIRGAAGGAVLNAELMVKMGHIFW